MGDFLDELLSHTRFNTNSPRIEFTPRRVGLGYALVATRASKSVLAPVKREARKRMEERRREDSGKQDRAESESSEEVSRLAYINKKQKS
ncbi:hypothetical protein PAPHI01_0519 [Pancytospora philotis]|nr:hypothetical protein PAPHI01_0519 [Pancytospora philotis]